jgi:hypothetical protein
MFGYFDCGEQVVKPALGAGQCFVAVGECATGDEHVSQVVGGSGMRVGVECLVGDQKLPGGDFGEHRAGSPLAEPVKRGAGCACRADRLEYPAQLDRHMPGWVGEQLGGSAAQAAPGASALLVEFVLHSAVDAGVGDGQAGAVGAEGGLGSGWGDQPPLPPADSAGSAMAQGGGVARVAERAFVPADCRWAVVAAAGAGSGGAR